MSSNIKHGKRNALESQTFLFVIIPICTFKCVKIRLNYCIIWFQKTVDLSKTKLLYYLVPKNCWFKQNKICERPQIRYN